MSFTDENLRRLKEKLSRDEDHAIILHETKALIARLEAAEKVCVYALNDEEYSNGGYYKEVIEAWREAKGKK